MDVQHTGPIQGPSGCTTSAESRPGRIGPICLEAKQTGERSARKSACCVRRGGGWKRGMAEMVCHSQPKERANREHKLRPKPARQSPTLPVTAEGRTPLCYTTCASQQEATTRTW